MCGIVGYVGGKNAVDIVYQGLKRLEYRGYDSSGAAFITEGKLKVIKKEGRVEKLLPHLRGLSATIGIGHTRWATHGAPSDANAHPHSFGKISLVHNGIIENCAELKSQLLKDGETFLSETDSEVIVHLLNKNYRGDLVAAMSKTVMLLKGSYALMAICERENKIVAARYKSPLIVGFGNGENFCASDEPALAGLCDKITVLEDGDIAEITDSAINIFNADMNAVIREVYPNLAVSQSLGLGDCPHYMLKELREAPDCVRYTQKAFEGVRDKLAGRLKGVNRIVLVGCGTAYHAAMLGKRYFESMAHIPSEAETASEFRYKRPILGGQTVVFAISQSGETADTVEAARLAKKLGSRVIAVTNSLRSELTRIADVVVPVAAGPEICVAATKSYTGQVAALYLCACVLSEIDCSANVLENIANLCEKTIKEIDVSALAQMCASSEGVYFLGRDIDYAVAVEGSLKLKEVSYIPSEGYPSGELKHGTLALIDEKVACVFIITDEELADKNVNAVEQVLSRGGKTAVITNIERVRRRLSNEVSFVYKLPDCDRLLSPIVTSAVLFSLAYKTAVILERDPDKPRNLAKSVTTE